MITFRFASSNYSSALNVGLPTIAGNEWLGKLSPANPILR